MMTIPMDNSCSPSRELVQCLYNKNIKLENTLRKSALSKVRPDVNIWLEMRENYESIILEDHEFSEMHGIEFALWQLHYKRIEEFRAHINHATPSSVGQTSQGGKGPTRLDRIKRIRSDFKSFLSEATGFYHDLMLKIKSKYKLPLGNLSEETGKLPLLGNKGEKRCAKIKKGLLSCHRILIYLGDLSRYKGLYGEGDSVPHDFSAASSYYTQASSLLPSSGNPHHQLAILASYSGDDLIAVYRYFRSLAVDNPFSTARENLIIVFEKAGKIHTFELIFQVLASFRENNWQSDVVFCSKYSHFIPENVQNRQSYCQLQGNDRAISVKTPPRINGRGRGKGETKLLAKDNKKDTSPSNFTAFCIRFVRLNGILFTRTSLETFGEILSVVISDLNELLSSGPDDSLNFGSDASENALIMVRLMAILIYTVNVTNRETENQSYAEILQRSVLLHNAYTTAFEFVGHIVKRCAQLNDITSSFLLPAILVFVEWLACCPDIAAGGDSEERQDTSRTFFWKQLITFLNKLMLSVSAWINGDEDESCFFDMSKYDERETSNRMAIWEDFELRGFSPLHSAQLILDFSRNYHLPGTNEINEVKKCRVQRILAAVKALTNVVYVDCQQICFNQKLKKFTIGIEPQLSELVNLNVSATDDLTQEVQVAQIGKLEFVQNSKTQSTEGEDEDEVIVFKPMLNEKHSNPLKSTNDEAHKHTAIVSAVDSSFVGLQLSPFENLLPNRSSTISPSVTGDLGTITPNLLQQANLRDSKWLADLNSFLPDYPFSRNLKLNENDTTFMKFDELQNAFSSVPQSSVSSFQFSLPDPDNHHEILLDQSKISDVVIPSKLDSVLLPCASSDGSNFKLTPSLPNNSTRKKPVSRPSRHFGPPPGFFSFPSKRLDQSIDQAALKKEQAPLDDYTFLDGYQITPVSAESSNYSSVSQNNLLSSLVSTTNDNNSLKSSMSSFPFPGKHIPQMVEAPLGNSSTEKNLHVLEYLKFFQENHPPNSEVYGKQQSILPPEQNYLGQSPWSTNFFV